MAVVALLLTVGALALTWTTQQRVNLLEQELVRRQSDSQTQAGAAGIAARAAQDLAHDSAAKVALLEVRVAEAVMQRTQVEELLQSVSRSRDENIVADVEAALRVAMQQSALTGSAEPLVATLQQIEARLARHNQPRLERVRRAVNRDLDRLKTLGTVDIAHLTLRLDEAMRMIDGLPLLAQADPRGARQPAAAASRPATAASSASTEADWRDRATHWWQSGTAAVVNELRSLVRVSSIEHPEAMLMAPEQQFFLRENLKLRLLNARLALLSRQFDIAQSDIRDAQSALARHFEPRAKRVAALGEMLRQVSAQSRQTSTPQPDDTLAALAAVAAGR